MMAIERSGDPTPVTEDEVRALAQVAGLPLKPDRAATLARALEADLRAMRRLRAVDAGDASPAGVAPLAEVRRDG
jgi:Asp-tRNA(Asn)/Glu-tRNA(Gln) amidotransferase C subunit